MKRILFSLIMIISFSGVAQQELNNYKYIIVPKKFDGFKRANQHQTSTLIKYLFVERGFNVIYDDALPEDLNRDRCLGLLADLQEDSSMFSTKLRIALKDCKGQEVYTSQIGASKQKDFKSAYNEAIRAAFVSYNGITYEYIPATTKETEVPVTVSFKDDVKQIEPENKTQAEAEKTSMVVQEATPENQSYKDQTPVISVVKKVEKEIIPAVKKPGIVKEDKVLYAQEISNGYQLVDSTPKILYRLYKSAMPNLYHAQTEDKKGIVYSKGEKWFFEYFSEGVLKTEALVIKF